MYISVFNIDRYYDDLEIVSFKEDTQSLYFGVVLKKMEFFGAELGIFNYNVQQNIGTFKIIHTFLKSKS